VGHAGCVVQSRAKRVRSGPWGTTATAARVRQREQAREPPPVMAYRRASGMTALGDRVASGCLGPARLSGSTA
jgi:hypothetical protein